MQGLGEKRKKEEEKDEKRDFMFLLGLALAAIMALLSFSELSRG